MGLAELILAVVIAAKLFGAEALVDIGWGTIALCYGGLYAAALALVAVLGTVAFAVETRRNRKNREAARRNGWRI